jgi:hypothetical protein
MKYGLLLTTHHSRLLMLSFIFSIDESQGVGRTNLPAQAQVGRKI